MKLKIKLTGLACDGSRSKEFLAPEDVEANASLQAESADVPALLGQLQAFIRGNFGPEPLLPNERKLGADIRILKGQHRDLQEKFDQAQREISRQGAEMNQKENDAALWAQRAHAMRDLYDELEGAVIGCNFRRPSGHAKHLKSTRKGW